MMRRQHLWIAIALTGTLASQPALLAQEKPAPEISAVTPTDLATSAKPRSMAVTGRYFQDGVALSVTTPGGAIVKYNTGVITDRRDTSFNAMVLMADAGRYEFVAVNPDGRVSAPFRISVKAAAVGPVVTGVRPTAISKSVSPQTLTVDGKGFMAGLTVMVTGPSGTVTTIPSPDISQVLPDSFQITLPLEMSGIHEIIVKNPDGALSKTFTFEVQR